VGTTNSAAETLPTGPNRRAQTPLSLVSRKMLKDSVTGLPGRAQFGYAPTVLIEPTRLPGAHIIRPDLRVDDRGYFTRSYCELEFAEYGLPIHFPQCNISRNYLAGTLRGMHFETPPSNESKLVRCISGAICDVIIDLRPGSSTRFEWLSVELTRDNGIALFVPSGFAHGFITLADDTDVFYHMGDFYHSALARGLRYNDPAFGIKWPREPVVISERDRSYPDFDVAGFNG